MFAPPLAHDGSYDATAELVRINPVPSFIMDMATLSVAVANQALAQLTGYSIAELEGQPLKSLVPDEDVPRMVQASAEPAPEGETSWRCRIRSGEILYVKIKYRDTLFRKNPARFVVVIETSEKPFAE